MTIIEKIKSINYPKIKTFDDGSDETIKDFFEHFIKPRLPQETIIREWHKLLKSKP